MKKNILNRALMLLPVLALLLMSSNASAKLIQLSGDFQAFGSLGTTEPPSVETLEGTWSLMYDDAMLTAADSVIDVSLTSLTLSTNPLGGVLFDTTNAGARLTFFGFELGQVNIGGLADGEVANFDLNIADFALAYSGSGQDLRSAYWVLPMEGFVAVPSAGGRFTASVVAVPEPATLGLLSFGLLGLGLARRKRQAASPS